MSFLDPSSAVSSLSLQAGSVVADIGSGSGHFSFALARAVGESGKVYAVDIQKPLLEKLERDAQGRGVGNISVLLGNAEEAKGIPLADGVADAAVASNILFQIDRKADFAREAVRILKPRGKLLLIDWSDSFVGMGPEAGRVVSESEARKLFEAAGCSYERSVPAGSHHYGIIFRKK